MTYAQVLNELEIMIANGNFTYLNYINLVSQNWFSFAQWVFSYAIFWTIMIFGSVGVFTYTMMVVNSIKEEIEG